MTFLPWYTRHWQPLNPLLPLLIILHCDCLLLFSIYILLISQECRSYPEHSASLQVCSLRRYQAQHLILIRNVQVWVFLGSIESAERLQWSSMYFGSVWWFWNFTLKNSGHLFHSLWTSKFKIVEVLETGHSVTIYIKFINSIFYGCLLLYEYNLLCLQQHEDMLENYSFQVFYASEQNFNQSVFKSQLCYWHSL